MKLFISIILLLSLSGFLIAEEPIAVQNIRNERYPSSEPPKIYASVCTVLAQQFGRNVRPQAYLVLGADRNNVNSRTGEIRLKKWNPDLFAQGVVFLGVHELMNPEQLTSFAQRALNWSNATVSADDLRR